jgi:septum formation protein
VIKDIEESYPNDMPVNEIAEYIACKKAAPYKTTLQGTDNIVLTADTIVVVDDEVLGKPKDENDAIDMLMKLSGKTHQVYTGVCLTAEKKQRHFSVCTDVTFKTLSKEEIMHYVSTYKPFDKAGAYGIQEWIGYIGITGLNGSYYNVMGLPV